ncbi:hypothetical protein B0G84_5721 [Paraburkholderia sp. BL8N3]|nr:hypothetical protein [Paraburkholderia sp. BL8N3]TCK36708.1 hypothetical protein B0G84_5721 [Paraburkholderia sp. BL8N3]
MDRARAALLHPATRATITFIFTVHCEGGTFAPIIEARDEPSAWVALARDYPLRGVRSIEVEAQAD